MKRCLQLLLFFLSFSPSLHAQKQGQTLIDSLLDKLPYGENDSNKVKLLNALCKEYASLNSKEGIKYGKRALAMAEDIGWKQGIAIAKNRIGGNYEHGADYANALSYYFDALKINEELGNKQEIALNYGNIGNIHYIEKNWDKAFDYYQQAYNINEQIGNKEKMATNLGNLGNIYSHYFDTAKIDIETKGINRAKTLDYYTMAFDIYKQLGKKAGMARNLGNAGNIFVQDNDKTEALRHYSEALKMYEELGNKMAQAAFLINIEGLYQQVATDTTGKFRVNSYTSADKNKLIDKGIEYTSKALPLAVETNYLEAVQASLGNLANLYAIKGEYKKAYELHKNYSAITDSIYKQNNAEQVTKLEAQNNLDLQDRQIQIRQLEVAKKRNTSFFLAGGMLLLLIVIVFILKQRKKSEKLLLNILPGKIAERLKRKEHPIADQFSSASIMFIDIADFTHFSSNRDPKELVSMLNDIFTEFDVIAEKHGLEKIKTIGDCYMAVSGLPQPRRDHALAAANMALEVKEHTKEYKTKDGTPVRFRVGLDCGPVVAGVIGSKKFIYDLWGDPVNTASRMESTGVVGEIHCTENFMQAVENRASEQQKYTFATRGTVEIKGKGKMQTYLLKGQEMPETVILN